MPSLGDCGCGRLAEVTAVFEVVAIVLAVAVSLLLMNVLVSRVLGVSLLCNLGFHRWHKELVGRGRDARYVVKCQGCEVLKDDS